ncbi:MAG: hypothetical protein PUP93_18080 [Rhizonema sp. NSF051]|nr:hypothetical protein [Rhizonema sp. NSF051]
MQPVLFLYVRIVFNPKSQRLRHINVEVSDTFHHDLCTSWFRRGYAIEVENLIVHESGFWFLSGGQNGSVW